MAIILFPAMYLRFIPLLAVLALAPASAALAQTTATPDGTATLGNDSLATAALGTSYLDNVINGYAKAEILGVEGKNHSVWIPVNPHGFSRTISFHRTEAEVRKVGRTPYAISLNKVQSLTVNGLYQEHMIVDGERQRILATRLINGPVELFNYTDTMPLPLVVAPGLGLVGALAAGAASAGLSVIPGRTWFLRRQGGELVQVQRDQFVEQMAEYFQGFPAAVSALRNGALEYTDMVELVRSYNEYIAQSGSPQQR